MTLGISIDANEQIFSASVSCFVFPFCRSVPASVSRKWLAVKCVSGFGVDTVTGLDEFKVAVWDEDVSGSFPEEKKTL